MLSTNTTTAQPVEDQLNCDATESKAGTRKGKYYRELGLGNQQNEQETEHERLRREYFQKVNEDATIYTIQESLNEFGSTPGTSNSIRRRVQNNGFRLSQHFDSDAKIINTSAKRGEVAEGLSLADRKRAKMNSGEQS